MDHLQDNRELLKGLLEDNTPHAESAFQKKKKDYFAQRKLRAREMRPKIFNQDRIDQLEHDWTQYARESLSGADRLQWSPFRDSFLASLVDFLSEDETRLSLVQLEAIESAIDNFSVLCGDCSTKELAQSQSALLKCAVSGNWVGLANLQI